MPKKKAEVEKEVETPQEEEVKEETSKKPQKSTGLPKVLTRVKHNGVTYEPGDDFSAGDAEATERLRAEGVLE